MERSYNRRKFIRDTTLAGVALGISRSGNAALQFSSRSKKLNEVETGKRIGIIGLDTSHSVAFTEALNDPLADKAFAGFKVVAAYPKGSNDIQSSVERIKDYTEKVKSLGVEIVSSIAELLTKVDVVLLETNDGRLHLEQALQVRSHRKLFSYLTMYAEGAGNLNLSAFVGNEAYAAALAPLLRRSRRPATIEPMIRGRARIMLMMPPAATAPAPM